MSQATSSVSAAVNPEARTELAGYARSDDRMIFLPALADVMQECCDKQRPPVLNGTEDRGRERQLGGKFAPLDRSDIAERPQQVLIDRIVMIHIELHHRDDAAELGNEPAEYAGFVHVPQRYFRIALRGKQRQKNLVGFAIVPADYRRSAAMTLAADGSRRDADRRPSSRHAQKTE